jgi:hypothetical protein
MTVNQHLVDCSSRNHGLSQLGHTKMMTQPLKVALGLAMLLLPMQAVAQCVGYMGPGGPCSMGPGGGLSMGPNPWRRVPVGQ